MKLIKTTIAAVGKKLPDGWTLTSDKDFQGTLVSEGRNGRFAFLVQGDYMLMLSQDTFNGGELYLSEDYSSVVYRMARYQHSDPEALETMKKAPPDLEGENIVCITGPESDSKAAFSLLVKYRTKMPSLAAIVWVATGEVIR